MLDALRYHWYRFKYHHGKSLPLRVPVDVSLELASDCNMKCGYCYHADQARLPFTKGVMSLDTAAKILSQAADLGVNSLKMNWKGESTINPDFRLITKMAKELAHGSTFIERITNSNFKFRSTRDDIFDGLMNQTKVKVSFDSFDKAVFESQRNGGDHTLTRRNIDIFHQMLWDAHRSGRKHPELVIQAVRTQANKSEPLADLITARWPKAKISIRDMVAGRVQKDVSALETRVRGEDRQSCEQAHVRLLFNWRGDAFPCCPDIGENLKYGNIHQTSMRGLFNSAFAKALRSQLKDGSAFAFDPCRTCSSFESYKGFVPKYGS
jgi:radical SAM protein with 4Fe4S-binding SPASM domain